MKTLISFAFAILSITCFGQETNLATGGGVSCSCLPGYSTCSSSCLFMSCCICCQSGSSCGCWSAFGFCGCTCHSTSSLVNLRFYPNKYEDFMNYLDRNNISSQKLRGYAADAISGLAIIKSNTPQDDYILLTDNSLIKNFDDAYINDMKALSMNNDIAKILDSYLNKK